MQEPSAEGKTRHHRMGIKSIGDFSFEGSVYSRECPRCGAPPFYWCRSKSGKRLGDAHEERSGPPTMKKE